MIISDLQKSDIILSNYIEKNKLIPDNNLIYTNG